MNSVSKTVMVADADPHVRDLVGRFISEAGYQVSFATDGYQALDDARRKPPLAILADILLPKLDGLALCRLLKSDPETTQVVTVIVFSVIGAEDRAKQAGADAFIKKPLDRKRLLLTLEEATNRGSQKS